MNFSKYIGIPYKENGKYFDGVDCFGICDLIFRSEKNVPLHKFTEYAKYNVYTPDRSHKTITKKIPKILTIFDEIVKPYKIFDLFLFYQSAKKDIVNHMGIYIGNKQFIHSVENRESMVSRLGGYYEDKIYKILRLKDDI